MAREVRRVRLHVTAAAELLHTAAQGVPGGLLPSVDAGVFDVQCLVGEVCRKYVVVGRRSSSQVADSVFLPGCSCAVQLPLKADPEDVELWWDGRRLLVDESLDAARVADGAVVEVRRKGA